MPPVVTAVERSGPPVVLRAASCRARLSGRRPGARTAAHWAVPFSLRNGGPGKLRSTRRCRSRTRQGSGRRRCCWRTRRWPYTTSPRHRTLRRDMPRTGSGPARPTRQCRSRIRSRSDPGCCCSSCPRPHKSWRRRKTRRRGRAPSRPRNASRPPPRGRRRTSRARIAPPWIDTSVAAPTEAERVRLETEAERVRWRPLYDGNELRGWLHARRYVLGPRAVGPSRCVGQGRLRRWRTSGLSALALCCRSRGAAPIEVSGAPGVKG